jgi:thioredoxin 1
MKTLFYFTAGWCEPCRILGPTMDQLKREGMSIERVDIEYETDRTKAANVQSVPTVVLAENGQELRRFVGVRTRQQILDFYNQ